MEKRAIKLGSASTEREVAKLILKNLNWLMVKKKRKKRVSRKGQIGGVKYGC